MRFKGRPLAGADIVTAALKPLLRADIDQRIGIGGPFERNLRRGGIECCRPLHGGNNEAERIRLDAIAAVADGIREKQDVGGKPY